jgi:2-polyprenyl-3-methyl-5-hydroxy-6-metoxy-1,4-benzoquinol methylase
MPDKFSLSEDQVQAIRSVPHFADGAYRDLPILPTLDFYKKRYVDQLVKFRTVDAGTVIADIGAGYGWLAMAFAAYTPAHVIAIEMDAERMTAGRRIAEIMGLGHRITWRSEGLGAIKLADRSVDVAYCIEVLEHVRRAPAAVTDLARLSRDLLIVTTPNLWFPVIAHDTRLPLCHWLPLPARQLYAQLFGRQDAENDNLFWSGRGLGRYLAGYLPVAGFLHYPTLDDYVATYPFHLPYVGGGTQDRVGSAKLAYYRLVSKLGPASRFVMPNLAMVWRRAA